VIRLLLVNESPAVRQGLRMRFALEHDLIVVGEVKDLCHALPLAMDMRPDVILVDLDLSGVDGIDLATFRRHAGNTAIVLLTLGDDPDAHRRAEAAGADAIVDKQQNTDILLRAIRDAAA